MINLYAALDLPQNATSAQIRGAYRRKARTAHLDAGGSRAAWDAIQRAHDVLLDPDRRAHYDRTGEIALDTADNTAAFLVDLLGNVLSDVLANLPAGVDPTTVNLADLMREALSKNVARLRRAMDDAERERKKIERLLDRFRVPAGHPNQLEAILRARLSPIVQQIAAHQEGLRLNALAETYLAGLEFRADAPPASQWTGSVVTIELRV